MGTPLPAALPGFLLRLFRRLSGFFLRSLLGSFLLRCFFGSFLRWLLRGRLLLGCFLFRRGFAAASAAGGSRCRFGCGFGRGGPGSRTRFTFVYPRCGNSGPCFSPFFFA